MRNFKSTPESDFDKGKLIHAEDEHLSLEVETECDGASNYSDYQENSDFHCFETGRLIAKTGSLNSMLNLGNCDESTSGKFENAKSKSLHSILGENYTVLKEQEIFSSTSRINDAFSKYMKCWSLFLRCGRGKLSQNGKIWRSVFVKLEESTLKFHAESFESSPPFKVIHLSWFHSFQIPGIQTKIIHGKFLFTAILTDALDTTRGLLAKTRCWSKGAEVACANYNALLDFIDTVEYCVSCFPAFRPAGIVYKTESVSVRVQNVYEVLQNENIGCQEKRSVSSKQVQIMLKAKVTASPECGIHVKQTGSFSNELAKNDITFHKCVKTSSLNSRTVTACFSPLDNCWFKLMSWKSFCSKPTPLRCQVTVTVGGYGSVQICARIFTGSTRLEVTSASDIILRFHIPLEYFETEKISSVQTIQHCTNVTKGSVSYSENAEAMVWLIPKLSFNPYRNFYLTGKPLATLNSLIKLPSFCQARDLAQVPVEMDFCTKASAQWSDVAIPSLKLDLKTFRKFKTSYAAMYHVKIPVTM